MGRGFGGKTYFCLQKLKVTLNPAEGNCAPGCTYDAPSTTSVQLTGLTSGQNYTIFLSTESYGKSSETVFITEELQPGAITLFRTIVSSDKVTT